jgi:hypothetical protein
VNQVEKIAAAVLYEGYVLWPYRRSAQKNQQRWTIGGIYPRAYSEAANNSDPWLVQTQCVALGHDPVVQVKARFLQVVQRRVGRKSPDGTLEFVDEMRLGSERYLTWDEATEREITSGGLRLSILAKPQAIEIEIPADCEEEPLHDENGEIAGALVRSWEALSGRLEISAEPLPDKAYKLTGRLTNTTPWRSRDGVGTNERPLPAHQLPTEQIVNIGENLPPSPFYRTRVGGRGGVNTHSGGPNPLPPFPEKEGGTPVLHGSEIPYLEEIKGGYPSPSKNPEHSRQRQSALPGIFAAAHVVLTIENGEFVSLTDPPSGFEHVVAGCENIKTWPVLVGEEGDKSMLLSSPIILPDYPEVAPESSGDFFDGAEIDQLLVLNILTLTDEEKAEMRASDPRTRAILERTESMTADDLLNLHGTIREFRMLSEQVEPDFFPTLRELETPLPQSVTVDGVEVAPGSRVRLRPRAGGDVMDVVLAGKVAIVEGIEQDYEDRIHLSVTIEDDPGRDLGMARYLGHRFFFAPEEVEPLDDKRGQP